MPRQTPVLIVDFDSTWVAVESLEVLGTIALAENPQRRRVLAEIARLTTAAMNHRLDLHEALCRRLTLLRAERSHLPLLIRRLRHNISASFRRNREPIRAMADRLYVLSAGFHEFIDPIVADFGIPPERVFANRMRFAGNRIIGLEEDNPLAANGGKVSVVRRLGLDGPAYALGDAMTDLELELSGVVLRCFISTENVRREAVLNAGGWPVAGLDEVLATLRSLHPESGTGSRGNTPGKIASPIRGG